MKTRLNITRAVESLVRAIGRVRIDQAVALDNRGRLGRFPVGIAVDLGPFGHVRYIRVRVGHADGYDSYVAGNVAQALLEGSVGRSHMLAEALVEGAVCHAVERQTRVMRMTDEQLRADASVPQDILTAEFARRPRLAPRARTREEREFGRAA